MIRKKIIERIRNNDFNMITAANNGNTVENQNADNLTVANFDNPQPSFSGTNTQQKKKTEKV